MSYLFNVKQLLSFVVKEIRLEWRSRYAINGIVLYLISTIFICYLSFNVRSDALNPVIWNVLFWIIILFSLVNAVAKSFIQETEGSFLYLYWTHSPQTLIVGRTIYNGLLMLILGSVGFVIYSLVLGNPVQDLLIFFLVIVLGTLGLSFTMTMVSAIASKARNSNTLMAILSFPIVLPMLLMIIKISKNAISGVERAASLDDFLVLGAINALVGAASYLLFPYLWRS
ncbi:MAG: heme exporter protein CcmB [Bacteroidota bacterium]